jgi:hypothetical protein
VLKIIYHFIRLFMPICFTVVGSSPTPASPNPYQQASLSPLFPAVQFFDTNWTQEVRILRPTHRIPPSDADARTLELQEDLLI